MTAVHSLARFNFYFFLLYGDWFVGLKLTFSWLAFDDTASGVLPSFSPITLVGVFCFASDLSWDTSLDVQAFPLF